MANAYFQMYVHAVFAVKYRVAQIPDSWKHELMSVIGTLTNETGCKCIIVNGMPDHIHSFFGFKPTTRISDVMKNVKSKSSKWINEQGYLKDKFEWQAGYGCFTYGESQVKSVFAGGNGFHDQVRGVYTSQVVPISQTSTYCNI